MADNGIYSDGFQDGHHAAVDELADIFNNAEDANELSMAIESFLSAEGAL
jgi:hypothetical protein